MERNYYKCTDCLSVAAVDETASGLRVFVDGRCREPKCGACGGACDHMGTVGDDGRLYTERSECPCDARCTSALGPHCQCPCGGTNHGSARLVTVRRDAGPIPVLRIVSTEKSARVVAEWHAARDVATAEKDAIEAKRREGWISNADYGRLRDLYCGLRRARALRTHKGRMNVLTGLIVESAVAI